VNNDRVKTRKSDSSHSKDYYSYTAYFHTQQFAGVRLANYTAVMHTFNMAAVSNIDRMTSLSPRL